MGDLRYANEKFHTAAYALARNGSLKKRLHSAYMSFHPIQAKDFADPELRALYEEIMRRLTVVEDADKGYVPATLEKMTDEEADAVSSLIMELAFGIQDACARD